MQQLQNCLEEEKKPKISSRALNNFIGTSKKTCCENARNLQDNLTKVKCFSGFLRHTHRRVFVSVMSWKNVQFVCEDKTNVIQLYLDLETINQRDVGASLHCFLWLTTFILQTWHEDPSSA